MAPLRTVGPTSPVAAVLSVLGTFLLIAAFYALTAHVAARWVIGETPFGDAVRVGAVLGVVSLGAVSYRLPVVVPLAVLVDAVALLFVYDESLRTTGILTVVHVLVSVALGISLVNLVETIV